MTMIERFESLADRAAMTVRLRGECDVDDVDAIHEAVAALGAASDSQVVIDLGELTFMGSAGLSALIEVRNRYPRVTLRRVPENFRRVLDLTGMSTVFPPEG